MLGTLAVTQGIAASSAAPAAADSADATVPKLYAAVLLAVAKPNLLPIPASVDATQAYVDELASVTTAVPTWPYTVCAHVLSQEVAPVLGSKPGVCWAVKQRQA